MSTPYHVGRLLGLSAVIISTTGIVLGAEPHEREVLESISAEWRARRERTRNVVYDVSGRHTFMKGLLVPADDGQMAPTENNGGGLPKENYTSPVTIKYVFDLQHDRFRIEKRDSSFLRPENVFIPSFRISVCDGAQLWSYMPTAKNTNQYSNAPTNQAEVMIHPVEHTAFVFDPGCYPILFAHGIFPIRGIRDPISISRLTADQLSLSFDGKGILEGHECYIVKVAIDPANVLAGHNVFWVSPEMEGAIVRWEIHVPQGVFAKLEIDYDDHASGWLPSAWVYTSQYLALGHKPRVDAFVEIQVDRLVLNSQLNDSNFQIPLEAQQLVEDGRTGREMLRVADDGKSLVPLEPNVEKAPKYRSLITLALAAIVLALVVLIVFRRSGATKRDRSNY